MNPDRKRQELARSRAVATGLLLAMTGVFVLATVLGDSHAAWPYVRAFAEAAMVGALADWFAVAALFRRPLGLPIPHTAVVPRNKERIGESLGRFVEEHFLPPEVITARLAGVDFAALLARWLGESGHAEAIADQATRLLPALLRRVDSRRLGDLVRDKLARRLEALDLAALAADILAALAADRRHQGLLDTFLAEAAYYLAEKAPLIREKVRNHTGWLWRKLAVDEKAVNGIMHALGELLQEVEDQPDHELRRRFDQVLEHFIVRLRESPDYRRRAEALRERLVASPAVQDFLGRLWDQGCDQLLADLDSPEPETRRYLLAALRHLGDTLAADGDLGQALNRWLRSAAAEAIASRREALARLIPDTVRTWDADTMAERLELQVGRDLQFIRINGTLVGGLVGLLIHIATRLAGF